MKQKTQTNKALLWIEKHSDYLEAYSSLINHQGSLEIIFVSGLRNNIESINVFLSTIPQIKDVKIETYNSKPESFLPFREKVLNLQKGDIIIAPFVRYRKLWEATLIRKSGIITIQLSESLTDSFGKFGYRLAFCNTENSRYYLIGMFLMPLYWSIRRPDLCYFPLMPHIKNPFTKQSLEPLKPPLAKAKYEILNQLLDSTSRPLVIAGFGYDINKMAASQGWKHFIATSKNNEIIIDGVTYQIPIFIGAEDVLLFIKPTAMISYTSTAVVWAKRWYPDLKILCYQSTAMEKRYGFLYTKLAARSLLKLGIKVIAEDSDLLS